MSAIELSNGSGTKSALFSKAELPNMFWLLHSDKSKFSKAPALLNPKLSRLSQTLILVGMKLDGLMIWTSRLNSPVDEQAKIW